MRIGDAMTDNELLDELIRADVMSSDHVAAIRAELLRRMDPTAARAALEIRRLRARHHAGVALLRARVETEAVTRDRAAPHSDGASRDRYIESEAKRAILVEMADALEALP